MITISRKAATEVKRLLEQSNEYTGLRLAVTPGGCTGFSYGMGLDSEKDGDTVYRQYGVKIIVDQESEPLLKGSDVDFKMNVGFQIYNPNVTSMCGCGSSFRTEIHAGQPGPCN